MRLKSGNSVESVSKALKLLSYFLAGVAIMGVGASAQKPHVVRVDGGDVQGVADAGVISYKGNPFAAAPVGDLRWRPPQPAARWTGVHQAEEFGTDCMQGRFGPPLHHPTQLRRVVERNRTVRPRHLFPQRQRPLPVLPPGTVCHRVSSPCGA